MSLVQSFRLVLAPPHPSGRIFIGAGVLICVLGLLVAAWLAWLGLVFALVCLYFFRDPARVPPGRVGLVLAPADGKVLAVVLAPPPAELGVGTLPRCRVSIFLSVLNVHVNRIPVDGTITRIAYRRGRFVNASLDKASEANERNALAIRLADGRDLAVVQIAGLIARRIVCYAHEGDVVRAGERFGIIRFGSRTDIYLPEAARALVVEGQTMIGGETVIADLTAA
jgi:phosphatidylserine decarboxylase